MRMVKLPCYGTESVYRLQGSAESDPHISGIPSAVPRRRIVTYADFPAAGHLVSARAPPGNTRRCDSRPMEQKTYPCHCRHPQDSLLRHLDASTAFFRRVRTGFSVLGCRRSAFFGGRRGPAVRYPQRVRECPSVCPGLWTWDRSGISCNCSIVLCRRLRRSESGVYRCVVPVCPLFPFSNADRLWRERDEYR